MDRSAVELLLDLAGDRRAGPKQERLTGALREAIVTGRLGPGTRLPSSRSLAADLRLSRGVVVAAYDQLAAEGRLVTRPGSGTTVAVDAAPATPRRTVRAPAAPPAIAPLRPGVPDLSAFPRAAWRRSYERALAGAADAQLDYPDPAGAPSLRRELADYLRRVRAARVGPDDITVTAGAAQAVALLATALRGRGQHRVALEDPASAPMREHLIALGLRVVPVPVDAGGIDVAALARTRSRAVLVTPAHQFPTGVVLAPARRGALVAWARRTGGLILEDDYDAEFRYDREPVGCLQGLAPDVVALIGSTSKALAPGLRRGWLTVPPGWRDDVVHAKHSADLGAPILEQLAFADFLATGGYDRHLRRARRAQRLRRDATVAALHRYLPEAAVSGVAAGLHLVAELPPGTDDVAIADRAGAAGLGPVPLSTLYARRGGPPGLVLGYAAHSPDELTGTVRLLARLVRGT
jgi:GntR family transcriptional regulator/MocR family aminotransferase